MRYFARNNPKIHVVGFDQLMYFGELGKHGEFLPPLERKDTRKLRSHNNYVEQVIPAGHLENGGVVVAPINWPR